MPNRFHNQSGTPQRGIDRGSENDDRDYGRYVSNDEGDSSVRAGSYDQGREYGQRENQQGSGVPGFAGYGEFGQGDYDHPGRGANTGQNRYGQGEYAQDPGSHRGKGPKNFLRSDERLREIVCERLHDHPGIDASEITVTVEGGRVTLEGSVDSRQTKNAAEDVAEQVSQDVQNNLRVQRTGGEAERGERTMAATAAADAASRPKRD